MSREGKKYQDHLQFIENLNKVNQAIQGTNDLQQMMHDCLNTVLSIFECDRAFLLYPCDPHAPSWRVPMECTQARYPGAQVSDVENPMDTEVADKLRIVLNADGPVVFGPGHTHALPPLLAKHFALQSMINMAIYPKSGKPWEFGMQQCSHARVWTGHERQLFKAIGHRLADSLSVLLSYQELLENRRFLDNIVENIPNMIFVKDAKELRFVRLNKAGERLLGYSRQEMFGKNDYDFFPQDEADFFTTKDREVLDRKKLINIPEETIQTRVKGERILHTQKIPILDEAGNPVYLLGISEDITQRKKLEEQLIQSQKMEAVGQLAGGVAHDFNNMIGVIIGYTELAMKNPALDASLCKTFEHIQAAGHRSAEVTRQLLAFARKQTISPRVLNLNDTIKGMLKLLRRLIGEDLDLIWMPEADLWPVAMDPSQIDQILVNLCVNARDAISGVGRVTIETQNITFDDEYRALHEKVHPGEYVLLSVKDNGMGMDKRTKDKIFEPFFTTKEVGKGTGLGLATVYGIVKQNSGFINVCSEPGHGTSFKIYLPRHTIPADKEPKADSAPTALGGDETILIVEDETAHLEIVKDMLEWFGYRVLTASTPKEALLVATAHKEIHLLLSDVIMPDLTGPDLAQEIISLCPKITCLFMSGYTGNVISQHIVPGGGCHFIQKPFSMQQLASKVRETLDSI